MFFLRSVIHDCGVRKVYLPLVGHIAKWRQPQTGRRLWTELLRFLVAGVVYGEHSGTDVTGSTVSSNGWIGTRGAPGDVGSESRKLNSPLWPGGMATCTSKLG